MYEEMAKELSSPNKDMDNSLPKKKKVGLAIISFSITETICSCSFQSGRHA